MKNHVICAALCAGLGFAGLTGRVMGQTTSTTGPQTRFISGSNRKPLTAEQQMLWLQAWKVRNDAYRAIDAQDYILAEKDARKALTLGAPMVDEALASALYHQGRLDEAFTEYEKFVKVNWGYPRNELPFALLLLKRGEWAQAVAYYNGSLRRLGEGDLVRANSHFTPNVVQTKDLEVAIHIAMGLNFNTTCSMADGGPQDDKALIEYHQALILQPDSPLANYYYGYGVQKLAETQKLLEERQQKELLKAQAAFEKAALLGKGDVKIAAQKALKDQKTIKATKPKTT